MRAVIAIPAAPNLKSYNVLEIEDLKVDDNVTLPWKVQFHHRTPWVHIDASGAAKGQAGNRTIRTPKLSKAGLFTGKNGTRRGCISGGRSIFRKPDIVEGFQGSFPTTKASPRGRIRGSVP